MVSAALAGRGTFSNICKQRELGVVLRRQRDRILQSPLRILREIRTEKNSAQVMDVVAPLINSGRRFVRRLAYNEHRTWRSAHHPVGLSRLPLRQYAAYTRFFARFSRDSSLYRPFCSVAGQTPYVRNKARVRCRPLNLEGHTSPPPPRPVLSARASPLLVCRSATIWKSSAPLGLIVPAPVTTPRDGMVTLMASALVISGAMRAFKLAF